MRKTFTLIAIVATLFAFTSMSFGQTQAPNLGTLADFALFTSDGALTTTDATTITGHIGNNGGAVNVNASTTRLGPNTATYAPGSTQSGVAAGEVTILYNALLAAPCGLTNTISNDLTSLTLTSFSAPGSPSGVFCQPSAVGTFLADNGVLTLSGDGVFIIKLNSVLTTGISSSIVLTNGATANKVFFQVVGATNLGDLSIFQGTIVATGASTVGAGASVTGRILLPVGAINTAETSITNILPPPPASPPVITNLASSPSPVCADSPITFTATVTNAAPPYAFTLTNGSYTVSSIAVSNTFTQVLTASGSGQQTFSLIVSNVGSVTNATTNVSVNPLPTVVLTFPGGTTVVGPNTGTATITLPPGQGGNFGATGGVFYERVIIIDRINGYEIRQTDSNDTGVFPIRGGPFTLTVTNSNGCRRTVSGVIQFQ